MEFGVFDHVEHLPGVPLAQLYAQRLEQLEVLDEAGFHCYFVAEHHTPAIHAMAPSQNVFLAAASQRTKRLHLGPGVYVLPLYHPLRLIEEISMLDNLTKGRLELGVGRGGVLEAFFWGQGYDESENRERFEETLAIAQLGLSNDLLTYEGRFNSFDEVPMRLRPYQAPYPPFWYMRNSTTAASRGMNALFTGTLDQVEANIMRYRKVWAEQWGEEAPTAQGEPAPASSCSWRRRTKRPGRSASRPTRRSAGTSVHRDAWRRSVATWGTCSALHRGTRVSANWRRATSPRQKCRRLRIASAD